MSEKCSVISINGDTIDVYVDVIMNVSTTDAASIRVTVAG